MYLREQEVPANIVNAVLERRDALLRSLAQDHPFSLNAISTALRRSVDDERDLEMALVAAARALGFVAQHVSGSGEPDGIATFKDYSSGETKITLEAKSSASVPSLGALDFAGLAEHWSKKGAKGCLLVAPTYPNLAGGENSAVSVRARAGRISCWTVDQLARLVGAAESRHLTARHVLDIVLTKFAPEDVTPAVEQLLRTPSWERRELYKACLRALRELSDRLPRSVRTVDAVAFTVAGYPSFYGIEQPEIEQALRELANASQGMLAISGDRVLLIHGSYDEIERRVSGLTASAGNPRRRSTFRMEDVATGGTLDASTALLTPEANGDTVPPENEERKRPRRTRSTKRRRQ